MIPDLHFIILGLHVLGLAETLLYQYFETEENKMKNKYTIEGNKVKIYFKNKKLGELYTIVSLECLEKLLNFKVSWFGMSQCNGKCYVVCTNYLGTFDGKPKYKTIYLHRFIMDYNETNDYEYVVDHTNQNTLDNTLENLRIVKMSENLRNVKQANKNNNSTGVRNVSYDKSNNKYIVQISIDGKNTRMGSFDNLEDASIFAEECRKKYYKIK
jgi:hypothetical protein